MNALEARVNPEFGIQPITWSEASVYHVDQSIHLLGRLSIIGSPGLSVLTTYHIRPKLGKLFTISPLTMSAESPVYQTDFHLRRFRDKQTYPDDISTILGVLNGQKFIPNRFSNTWMRLLSTIKMDNLFLPGCQEGLGDKEWLQIYYQDVVGFPMRSSIHQHPQGETIDWLISNIIEKQQLRLLQSGILVEPYPPTQLAEDVKRLPQPKTR